MNVEDETTGFEFANSPDSRFLPLPRFQTLRYHVLDLLQQGGMGNVYRAEDRMLQRHVAIKVLRKDRTTKASAKDDFVREARMMSYLSHPGVTPVHEIGTCEDGLPFYVMNLIDGQTLLQLLRSRTGTDISDAIQVFASVCQTVAFAHSQGVIHLDLKPSNIMVGSFGEVVVMDWGLAERLPDSACPQSSPNGQGAATSSVFQSQINGTPEYMSPEQARGAGLDARADVFSLGGILCKILTGHAPYEGKGLRSVYRKAAGGELDSAIERLRRTSFHAPLVRLAINCLAIDRKARPENAVRVSETLTRYRKSSLERLEGDMHQFFELSTDMFCIADHQGYFLRVNTNFTKVLGYSEEALLSQPFLDLVHPDDQARTIDQINNLKLGRPVVQFRNRYRTLAGAYTTIEWMAKTIEGEGLIFAVARNV